MVPSDPVVTRLPACAARAEMGKYDPEVVMVSATVSLGLKEAAVVAGVAEKRIRKEIELRVLPAAPKGRHALPPEVAVFLRVIDALPVSISPEQRRALYDLFVPPTTTRTKKPKGGPAASTWHRDPTGLALDGEVSVHFSVDEIEREVRERVRIYLRGRARVVRDPKILGGEETFTGTRIPVALVGALATNGTPTKDLLEDFPALDDDDVRYAEMHVALGRRPGRPRRKVQLRKAG